MYSFPHLWFSTLITQCQIVSNFINYSKTFMSSTCLSVMCYSSKQRRYDKFEYTCVHSLQPLHRRTAYRLGHRGRHSLGAHFWVAAVYGVFVVQVCRWSLGKPYHAWLLQGWVDITFAFTEASKGLTTNVIRN